MKDEQKQAEELKRKDPEVAREIERTASPPMRVAPPPANGARPLAVLGVYGIILAALIVFYFLLRWDVLSAVVGIYQPLLEHGSMGAMAVLLVLAALTAGRAYLISRLEDPAARYNLNRVANLVAGIAIFFITLSILFANWYTAVVSLGLLSLVLGFALQTPISSFIGWIYILVKAPYRVGDRIRIGEATGDVLDVEYLDTTLWEFGGELLSTANHPSGRIIKFPNSKVLSSVVFNYSWPLFPYVWNDVKFQVAYQSDLDFVAKVMAEAAAEEVGEAMMERIGVYRELLSQTPVDQLEVKEHPVVVFRVSENTWIEAIVRYLVEPRQSGSVKSRLIKKILTRLNEEPDRVMFPKADNR